MEVEPTLYKNPPSKILEHKVLRIGPNHPNLEHLGGPWNGLDPRDGGKNEAAVGCPGVPPCLPQHRVSSLSIPLEARTPGKLTCSHRKANPHPHPKQTVHFFEDGEI